MLSCEFSCAKFSLLDRSSMKTAKLHTAKNSACTVIFDSRNEQFVLTLFVSMLCLYACVCIYVCMYVCMYVRLVRMYVFMYVCTCTYVRTYVCMYVCMHVCMYVHYDGKCTTKFQFRIAQ